MKLKRRSVVIFFVVVVLVCALGVFFALTFRGHSVADAARLNKGVTFDEVTEVLGPPSYPRYTMSDKYSAAFWELSDGYVRMLFDPQHRLLIVVSRPESTIPMLIRRVKWKFKLD